MKSPSPPPAPDPAATAAAQADMNRQTAVTQSQLNMVNQNTPYGSLNYNQIGKWDDGTPRFEATTQLTPEQQELLSQSQLFDKKFNEIGLAQTDKIGGILSQPVNLNNEATEARLYELGASRLDPRFAREEDALRTRLANQGINVGTEAYAREMETLNQSKNDAYNQLLLGGRGQAVQEALTERNQPINEITALLNGGQVQLPQFVNTPQSGVAGVDYAGLVQDGYKNQMNIYNQKMSRNNAIMGGFFDLGKAALGGWASGGFKT